MNNKIFIVLLLMMVFSLITGCHGESNISETKGSTSTQNNNQTKSPQDNDSVSTKIPEDTCEGTINDAEPIDANNEPILQSNYVYGGKVATDGSYQYFELYTLSDDIVGLCRIEKDGNNFSVLDNSRVFSINVMDNFLYFIQRNKYTHGGDIYRINKDGSKKTELIKGNYSQLIIIENKLYFLGFDDCKIYRMNADGSGVEVFISDECDTFLFSEGYIYTPILEKGTEGRGKLVLAKYDIKDSSKKTIIATDLPLTEEYGYLIRYFIYKDKILYIDEKDNNKIYIMNNDGTEKKELIDINVESMLISEDGTIYTVSRTFEEGMKIQTFNMDGAESRTIYSGFMDNYQLLGLVDDYIYYYDDQGEGNGETGRIKIDGTGNEILGIKLEE
ncbi:DUF5050 domain-containing protein [Lachnoclostridium phytofermentans]|uniref:DUF5050 domain-containing protein n=1 Tax=Lachnoclostridium phytofermentans TaxID=66219 RepID=UPI0004957AB7|nr:DUF5050 domain-containing protein [Lachnoclostridium phytofermentans]